MRGSKEEKGKREGNVISLDKRGVTYVSVSIRNCFFFLAGLCHFNSHEHIGFQLFAYIQTKYRGEGQKKRKSMITFSRICTGFNLLY